MEDEFEVVKSVPVAKPAEKKPAPEKEETYEEKQVRKGRDKTQTP